MPRVNDMLSSEEEELDQASNLPIGRACDRCRQRKVDSASLHHTLAYSLVRSGVTGEHLAQIAQLQGLSAIQQVSDHVSLDREFSSRQSST